MGFLCPFRHVVIHVDSIKLLLFNVMVEVEVDDRQATERRQLRQDIGVVLIFNYFKKMK